MGEATNVYYLTAKVTDSGVAGKGGTDLLSDTATITIQIIDVNEAPEIAGGMSTTVEENTRLGTQIGKPVAVRTRDQDKGHFKTLRYSISDGNTLGHFAIDRLDGQISVISNINYEARPEYTVLPKPQPICTSSMEPPAPKEVNGLVRATTGQDYRLPSGEEMECVTGSERSAGPNQATSYSSCPNGYSPFGLRQLRTTGLRSDESVLEQICNHQGCMVRCPNSKNSAARCYVRSQCCRSKKSQKKPSCTAGVEVKTVSHSNWSKRSTCVGGASPIGLSKLKITPNGLARFEVMHVGGGCSNVGPQIASGVTVGQCATKCDQTGGCMYFSYDPISKVCRRETTRGPQCQFPDCGSCTDG